MILPGGKRLERVISALVFELVRDLFPNDMALRVPSQRLRSSYPSFPPIRRCMDLGLSGLVSGLDWKTLVDQLAEAERAPQNRLRSDQSILKKQNTA